MMRMPFSYAVFGYRIQAKSSPSFRQMPPAEIPCVVLPASRQTLQRGMLRPSICRYPCDSAVRVPFGSSTENSRPRVSAASAAPRMRNTVSLRVVFAASACCSAFRFSSAGRTAAAKTPALMRSTARIIRNAAAEDVPASRFCFMQTSRGTPDRFCRRQILSPARCIRYETVQ